MSVVNERQLERSIRNLKPFSESALALTNLMQQSDRCIDDMMEIVARDGPLTARVLYLANAMGVAPASPIESVGHAIAYLGEQVVVAAALRAGAECLRVPLEGYRVGPDGVWARGLKVALAARHLARKSRYDVAPELAYTAGLLHDLGKPLLSSFLKGEVSEVIERVATGESHGWLAAERDVIGLDHCEAGIRLADHFRLGPALRAAIGHHHHPDGAEPEHRPLVEIVHVADVIADMMGGDEAADALSYPAKPEIVDDLGLDASDLEEVICATSSDFEDLESELAG